MRKMMMVVMICLLASLSSACVASRKFVRNEVKTTADNLNARIDTTDGEIKEVGDRVSRVDETMNREVARLDSKTNEQTQRLDTLRTEVQSVDQKAAAANQRVAGELTILDERFQNRNQFTVMNEKAVYFKFDSAQLDPSYKAMLDEIAVELQANPDAFVVLEGRTDATGNDEYNIRLGERRSEAVKRYLVVDKGVPVYRIHQISFGKARPVAENDSRTGREKNRAVTMMLLVPKTAATSASRTN